MAKVSADKCPEKCMSGGRGNHYCHEPKGHSDQPHRCVCGHTWPNPQGQVHMNGDREKGRSTT